MLVFTSQIIRLRYPQNKSKTIFLKTKTAKGKARTKSKTISIELRTIKGELETKRLRYPQKVVAGGKSRTSFSKSRTAFPPF